ncbi:transposase [Streptomyces sp. NPDC057806]|uniref:transposase n=1 Tax=Streptomyces sp. NPDC057806 TaxID=3346255 RepID=UPI0036C3A781
MGRGDLTNDQWARLEPLLPLGKKPGRPPVWTRRQLIDGIRWRTRTGAPWRDVPERYGPWDRAYDLFRRWQRDGTWKRVFEQLQAEADAKGLINTGRLLLKCPFLRAPAACWWARAIVESTLARYGIPLAQTAPAGARRPRPRTLARFNNIDRVLAPTPCPTPASPTSATPERPRVGGGGP